MSKADLRTLERTEIALAFIAEREREGVVAGLLDRHVKREGRETSQ